MCCIGVLDLVFKVWICGGVMFGMLFAGARGGGGDAFVCEFCKVVGVEYFVVEDDDGCLLLYYVVVFGCEEIVCVLVEFGCDIDVRDESEGSTALILAVYFECVDVVDVLFDFGVDFLICDDGNVIVGGYLV